MNAIFAYRRFSLMIQLMVMNFTLGMISLKSAGEAGVGLQEFDGSWGAYSHENWWTVYIGASELKNQ